MEVNPQSDSVAICSHKMREMSFNFPPEKVLILICDYWFVKTYLKVTFFKLFFNFKFKNTLLFSCRSTAMIGKNT